MKKLQAKLKSLKEQLHETDQSYKAFKQYLKECLAEQTKFYEEMRNGILEGIDETAKKLTEA